MILLIGGVTLAVQQSECIDRWASPLLPGRAQNIAFVYLQVLSAEERRLAPGGFP